MLGSCLRRAFNSLCPMAELPEPRGTEGGDRSGRNPADRFFRFASSPEQSLGAHLLQTPGPMVVFLHERLPLSQILPGLDRPLHLGRLQPFVTGSGQKSFPNSCKNQKTCRCSICRRFTRRNRQVRRCQCQTDL